jgi:hypothetical protein
MDRKQSAARRADAIMMQMTASHHSPPPNPAYVQALKACREALRQFIDDANCAPILLRTAWHDAGTYDPRRAPADAWPAHGGANGSIRFDNELAHGANAGLPKGIKFLQPLKQVRSVTTGLKFQPQTHNPPRGFSPHGVLLSSPVYSMATTPNGCVGPRAAPRMLALLVFFARLAACAVEPGQQHTGP